VKDRRKKTTKLVVHERECVAGEKIGRPVLVGNRRAVVLETESPIVFFRVVAKAVQYTGDILLQFAIGKGD
jgi:hypothetical protein